MARRGSQVGLRVVLAALGALLLGDAVALMFMDLINFGVVLPGAIGLGALLLAWRWQTVARWRTTYPLVGRLWRAGWVVFAVWLVSVAGFFHYIGRGNVVGVDDAVTVPPAAAILVLGSGTPHCEASRTLRARLDVAMVAAQRLPGVPLLVTGGQDFGLHCTEADVMATYLSGRGFPSDRVIREDRSTSTDENMRFSQRLLAQHGIPANAPLIVVTSDFHLPRAERIARKAGFTTVSGLAAPTPLYLRYNAWLREYFAYISGWLLREY